MYCLKTKTPGARPPASPVWWVVGSSPGGFEANGVEGRDVAAIDLVLLVRLDREGRRRQVEAGILSSSKKRR